MKLAAMANDDPDHNPRTMRSLPLGFHARPHRRRYRTNLLTAGVAVSSLLALVYWLRLPH